MRYFSVLRFLKSLMMAGWQRILSLWKSEPFSKLFVLFGAAVIPVIPVMTTNQISFFVALFQNV